MPGATTGRALEHRHDTTLARPDSWARGCDGVVDAVIVLMATWTVVYHVCFVLRVDSGNALLLEVGALALSASAWRALRRQDEQAVPIAVPVPSPATVGDSIRGLARAHPRLLWATVAAAVVAAVAMASGLPWTLVWVPWLVAATSGTALAWQRLGSAPVVAAEPAAPAVTRRESQVVVGAGVVLAALSLVTLRPNPDDLFYLNLSQWIATHGTFPHRDTIWADLTYPMANWPPLASYDAGAGALAHLLGVHAATVVYVLVPPVATLLSVLALWRLLRAWRVRHVLVALAAAALFLFFDGTSSYGSPGNLWVTRLWQGKVLLLCIVVPTLLVMALRYVEAPSRRRAAWLFVGGVASVACSTTAVFLVPLVALAGVAPLVRRAPRQAALGFAAMAAYPLVMGVVTVAVGGRSADDFGVRKQYRFDPSWFGHEVFLDGVMALVGVGAVLSGCLVVPHPAARVATGAAAVLTGVTFVPGLTHLTYDLVGLGPTLWRLTWSLSVAALVGAAASYAVTQVRPRRRALGAAGLVTALVAGLGHPILSPDTSTSFAMPVHWQRGPDSQRAAAWMLAHSRPGYRVLAPDGLSITVAVSTTQVKTVTPRDYYMYYLRGDPGFGYDQRLVLTRFANAESGWRRDQLVPALHALDVRIACVYRVDHRGSRLLSQAGYLPGIRTETYRCLTAPDAGAASGPS